MKNRRPKTLALFALALLVVVVACKNDDEQPISNALRILKANVNETNLKDNPTGIDTNISLEVISSHSLNTSAFESALSISSSSGEMSKSFSYTNSNSIVTITNTAELDYETVYTISLPAGAYGEDGNELAESISYTFTVKEFIPPNVTLSTDMSAISEAGGVATVTATMSEPVNALVTVELGFSGAATTLTDYIASGTSITIPAGQSSGNITLTAVDDVEVEGLEDVIVSVENVTNAIEATEQEVSFRIEDNDAGGRGLIINEVLFDPPSGSAGDANGDGSRSASEDEFIEFINDSDVEIDLSGFNLYDEDQIGSLTPRHTFANGTIIPAHGVYVLFGGGTPSGDFGGAMVGVSTTGNMNLNNAGDKIYLHDANGNEYLTFDTAVEGAGLDFGSDQSITRSPDITGDYTMHTVANAALTFTPGTMIDGSAFDMSGGNSGQGLIINEVLFDPASGSAGDANGDGTRSASEDEFIEFYNDSNSEIDLSGFTLYDEDQIGSLTPRHTFPNGTVIPAHGVYVLFGGGAPAGDFGNAQVGITTTGNMNLNNSGDKIYLHDANGNEYLTFDTAIEGSGLDFGLDQSITRSPDIIGPYMLHTAANAALTFSPGKKADGSNF
ncbi:MAG: lamin tail domain-containing protein [Cytophagia bacterium]|nr:lamin tail domain-containing protein [Cytophagia bacterium]